MVIGSEDLFHSCVDDPVMSWKLDLIQQFSRGGKCDRRTHGSSGLMKSKGELGLSWGQQWQGLGKVGTMHKFWKIKN